MAANPFKPTAGKMPPVLIGRQGIVDDFEQGLTNGAGAPERLMLLTGQRGYGKTVMLTELGRIARQHGWRVISETATPGMCDRIIGALAEGTPRVGSADLSPSIDIGGLASVSLGHLNLSPNETSLTLRSTINAQLRKAKRGKGILFSIDEAQAASMEDMTSLATTLQHVIRDQDMTGEEDVDKRGVAFAFAALPSLVDELLNDKVLTFLRRAVRRELGPVPIADVKNAFVASTTDSGKTISPALALRAARRTFGYPYMIQLVGYYMWQSAESRRSATIEDMDVEAGISDASGAFADAVCAPAYDGLTTAQKSFILAMTQDQPADSRVSDVVGRVGKSASWGSKYRASLIEARIIESAGYGLVRYAIPHFGDFLQARGKRL